MCVAFSGARTRTTQSTLHGSAAAVIQPIASDSACNDSIDQHTITLKGYNKRASDARESFFVTNNSTHRISHITLLLRYSTLDGKMLHERTVNITVDLKPRETRLVAITTFDLQRLFYYYAGPKPRKTATAFKVAFHLKGYDIPVGQ